MAEFRDVEEQDVEFGGNGDWQMSTGFLEGLNEASVVLIKTHSKTGMHNCSKIPEGLNEWLNLKGRAVLSKKLQLVDILKHLVACWAVEVLSTVVRGGGDV